MVKRPALIASILLGLYSLLGQFPRAGIDEAGSSLVYHLKISGTVDNVLATHVARALSVAEENGAKLIIVELDTPGGPLSGAWKTSRSLVRTKIPTVAWINKDAASAGAMVTYACKYIVMSPGATFGACVPIMALPIPTELPQVLPEKFISYTREQIRSLATERGHDPDIAEAMVDEAKEIAYSEKIPEPRRQKLMKTLDEWEDASAQDREEFKWFLDSSGKLSAARRNSLRKFLEEGAKIVEREKILTLDTDKAFLLQVAIGKAASLDEILELKEIRELNLGRPVVKTAKWSWSELAARFLSTPLLSTLLLIGGIVGIATELKMPGFGFPGILGITCIVLLFFGNFAAGAAQWTDLILFGVGVALLLVELLLIPGFGFVGILGIILIVAGIFRMLLKTPGPYVPAGKEEVVRVIQWMSISLIVSGFGIYVLFKLVRPRTPLFGRLVLAESEKAQEGYSAGAEMAVRARALVGKVGMAKSMLRPAGKAVFDGKLFDVVTQGDMIEKGTRIEIIDVQGNRVIVQRAKES
jgi:membrane-bound serine protease (ClpP class)